MLSRQSLHTAVPFFLALIAIASLTSAQTLPSHSPDTQPTTQGNATDDELGQNGNLGEDTVKPLKRLDFRFRYQDEKNGNHSFTNIVRVDAPFRLGEAGWKVTGRVDAPVVTNDRVSDDNPDGKWRTGFGDMLVQVLAIGPRRGFLGRFDFGGGLRVIIPTATQDQFARNEWQLGPTVAASWTIPEISEGTFLGLLIRNQFTVGDEDSGSVNDLVVEPTLHINLPGEWFCSIGSETKFNLNDSLKAFIPLEFGVGKKLGPSVVVSGVLKLPVVDDYRQYDGQLELRIGIFY